MNDIHEDRRKNALISMREGDVLLLFSAPEPHDLGGTGRFYQNRDFFYLTGFPEPDSAMLLMAGEEKPFRMFVRPRNPELERWTGKRFGVEGAKEQFRADEASEIAALEDRLAELLSGKKRVFYRFGLNPEYDRLVLRVLTNLRRNQRPENNPFEITDSGRLLHPLRLVKSEEEILHTRKSVEIAVEAFRRVIRETRVGMYEYQVEAMVEEVYRFNGCDGPSFPTIVAAGANATYLHYVENNKKIEPGELFLIDSGCLYNGYASDITRTFMPEGQSPSPEQRTLYESVLEVQREMIRRVKPGISLHELNRQCQLLITRKLVDLKILEGDPERIVAENEHKIYFPHRLGHWLGSDVHDAGSFGMEDPDLKLKPGMMLTIEPGIYIPDDAEGPAKAYAGIGVRIEDDILVTETGRENLSESLEKTVTA